jgi:hypothetical protein
MTFTGKIKVDFDQRSGMPKENPSAFPLHPHQLYPGSEGVLL